jgi:hypothetical protein
LTEGLDRIELLSIHRLTPQSSRPSSFNSRAIRPAGDDDWNINIEIPSFSMFQEIEQRRATT